MVPSKVNIHGKRNRTKIKSKMNKEKNISKLHKKTKRNEKATEDTKSDLKSSENESLAKSVPLWLQNGPFNKKMTPESSVTNTDIEDHSSPKLEEDFSDSEISEECNCDNADNTQNRIPKKTTSSSIVANYIKSGMDQVASFIVESAIKFGEQHGVIVPDKNNPNIYEFAPTDQKFGEKIKKIRFKIPKKSSGIENSENLFRRRSHQSIENMEMRKSPVGWSSQDSSKNSQLESNTESLYTIIPLLKKIKDEERLEKTESDNEDTYEDWSRKRLKGSRRSRRKKLRKSMESLSNKASDYSVQGMKGKKFRRDSIELGRRRLRATNCSRKQRSSSVTPS